MVVFECARCGTCCLKHVGKMAGHVHGLMILPEERKLFPEEIIAPMFRYKMGFKPDPGRVFMYQIDTMPCPHYAREEGACNIYSKRPVTCRTFPFELRGNGLAIHGFCPEIARLAENYKPSEIRPSDACISTMMELRKYWDVWMKTVKIERYDVEKEKWYHVLDGVGPEYLE